MSFAQALLYFVREASVSLVRSWKVSLLAVLTIAVSIFLGGVLLMVSSNLAQMVEEWREQARLVIYLETTAPREAAAALAVDLRSTAWVRSVEEITAEEARARFRRIFPSLEGVVETWGSEPLPTSFEVAIRPDRGSAAELTAWAAALAERPEVALVDDDRDWLRQVETALAVVRGVGFALSAVLLGAAIFTIASVVRLTAFLYREEIAIMRLVGATEFYIRGPFYVEGLLQGILGSVLSLAGLYGAYVALNPSLEESLVASVMATRFLAWPQLLLLVGLGGAAGLAGAIASLGRESLTAEG